MKEDRHQATSGDAREKPVKGRFAPSPTGRMHLGNVYAALMSWLSAKSQGGEWLLRIEDLDPQRSRAEYARTLMDDLLWLGLEWDEGPGRERDAGPYWQSERGNLYEQALWRLEEMGLVYPCTCTRADILATQAPHESDGRVVYRGTCRPPMTLPWEYIMGLRAGMSLPVGDGASACNAVTSASTIALGVAALRLRVPPLPLATVVCPDRHYGAVSVNLATHCGDFIVRRRDQAWAYQLAVVVDDALMGVTEVVRGRDLLLSAPQQMYVARLLGYEPPTFAHIPLLVNEAGLRLSKRDRSLDMGVLRASYTPEALLGRLAHLAGLTPDEAPVHLADLIPLFSWESVPTDDIVCRL